MLLSANANLDRICRVSCFCLVMATSVARSATLVKANVAYTATFFQHP